MSVPSRILGAPAMASGEPSNGPMPNMNATGEPAILISDEGLTLDPDTAGVTIQESASRAVELRQDIAELEEDIAELKNPSD